MAEKSKKETPDTGEQLAEEERSAALNREACIFMALAGTLAIASIPIIPFSRVVPFFQKAPVVEMCFAGIALGGVCGAYVLFMLAYIKFHLAYRAAKPEEAKKQEESDNHEEESAAEGHRKLHLVNAGITLCGTGIIVMVVSAITLQIMIR